MNHKIVEYMKAQAPACDVCGATAELMLGSTHRKKLKLATRCPQHAGALRQVFARAAEVAVSHNHPVVKMVHASGIPIHHPFGVTDGSSEAAKNDAAWFKANPHRTHRARWPFDAEIPGKVLEDNTVVIVRQVEPGKRMRKYLKTNCDVLPDDDDVLSVIFDIPPGGGVDYEEAVLRASNLKRLGGTA